MMFNNKPVLTPDDFDFSTVKIGDYVNQEVVDNAMDCLPPCLLLCKLRSDGRAVFPSGRSQNRKVPPCLRYLPQGWRRVAEQHLGVSRPLLLR